MACAASVHHCSTRSLQVLTPIRMAMSTVLLLLSSSISLAQASYSEPSQQAGLSFQPKEEAMIKQYNDKISKLNSIIKAIGNAWKWLKVGFLEEVKKKYPAIDIRELESKYNEVKLKLDIVRGLSETTRGAFIHFCTLMRTNGAPDLQTSKAKLDRSIEQTEEKLTPLEPISKGENFYKNVVRKLWHAQHDATASRANKGYKPLEPDSVLEQLDGKVVSTIVDAYVKLLSCTSDAEEAMQAAETALQEYKIALGLTSNKSETIMDKCCNSLSCLCMPTIPCVSNPLCQFGLFAGGVLLGKLSSDEFREAFKVRNYINETTTTTTTTTTGSTLVGSTSTPVGIPSSYSYSSDGNSQLWTILMVIVVVGLLFGIILALAFYYFYGKQNTSNSNEDLEAKCPGPNGPMTISQSQQSTTSGTTETITGFN